MYCRLAIVFNLLTCIFVLYREKLDKFLQNAREKDLILEMKVAESEEESDSFWRIRAVI